MTLRAHLAPALEGRQGGLMPGAGRAAVRVILALLLAGLLAACTGASPQGNPASGSRPAGSLHLKVGDQSIGETEASGAESGPLAKLDQASDGQKELAALLATWALIDQQFYNRDAIDYRKMMREAIRGMLDSLGDEETMLSDARSNSVATEDMRGSFEGIGVTVQAKDKKLVVVSPLDGSPGAKAGIMAGDVIVGIDDKDARDLSLVEAVSLIRGPRGTKVRISVEREGENQPLLFEITREPVNVVSVRSEMMAGNVGYLRVSQFIEPTAGEVHQHLAQLMQGKPKAIVLDLRNNPGGVLAGAYLVASEFIADGVVFYSQERGQKPEAVPAQPGGMATAMPLVVLINKGSASGAEVVAGALQDRGRAVLVGDRSYGKDSAQTVFPLDDGSAIHITIARWYTPNKQPIAGRGLTPDLLVPLTEEDAKAGRDPQLDRALERARSVG